MAAEKKTSFGKKSAMEHGLKNARPERTPWLLVTPLEEGKAITKSVFRLDQSRMQRRSVQGFKKPFGLSFRDCMTRTGYRLENLLLIVANFKNVPWPRQG